MELPRVRFTVRRMMVAVLNLAADLAVVRLLGDARHDLRMVFITLPMANVLLLAAWRARRGGPTRPFWVGFASAGGLTAMAFAYLCRADDLAFFRLANSIDAWLLGSGHRWDVFRLYPARLPYLLALDVICYTPPQVVMGCVAGQLSAECAEGLWSVPEKVATAEMPGTES